MAGVGAAGGAATAVGGKLEPAGVPRPKGSGCKSSSIGSGVTRGGTSTGILGATVGATAVATVAAAALEWRL